MISYSEQYELAKDLAFQYDLDYKQTVNLEGTIDTLGRKHKLSLYDIREVLEDVLSYL
jgi:hypothetical protein